MLPILLKTLPFFALIGLGYGAGRLGIFSEVATAALTRFVFFFALSAMLFRFAASLDFGMIWDPHLAGAYLIGTLAVYLLATVVARMRGQDTATAAVEAQCTVIGNVGFLGLPMLVVLWGPQAVPPIILILSIDLIVFSSLIVILITASRATLSLRIIGTITRGLLTNPMILAISAGLIWSASGLALPKVADDFLVMLGNAATPGALFAIGAPLASKSAERMSVAAWLSFAKLIVHPLAVAAVAVTFFSLHPFVFGVMLACAAMPVAGNVFMLAQHYGIAAQRVSAAILFSTIISVVTLTAVIGWASP